MRGEGRRAAVRTTWRLAAVMVGALACSDADGGAGDRDPLAVRGERVYLNVCVACHHGDPTEVGSVGPAIAGSSRELLEAKVVRGEYPPGYTPKRETAAMPPQAYLADQIDALEAYLAEAAETDATP